MASSPLFDLAGKRVYVAGHKGMMGAAIVRRLAAERAEILTAERAALDLTQQQATEAWLAKARPDAVFLAVGLVGGITPTTATRPIFSRSIWRSRSTAVAETGKLPLKSRHNMIRQGSERGSMNPPRITLGVSLLVLSAALAGCETTGSGGSAAVAAKPPEPPMTHARAATECWMSTEKTRTDLDKRADIVTKCIDQKMKAAGDAPKT